MLWIVGKRITATEWEFQGVFDSHEQAVAACQTDDYFIAPAELNEAVADVRHDWPGAYYPRLEDAPAIDEVRRPTVTKA